MYAENNLQESIELITLWRKHLASNKQLLIDDAAPMNGYTDRVNYSTNTKTLTLP